MCLPIKPFKVEREWKHAGLLCAVTQPREHHSRCGYVRIPPGHPAHGKGYDDIDVDVHGGLTLARGEPCQHEDGTGWWFGFDCAHLGDLIYEPGFAPAGFLVDIFFGEHFWTEEEVADEVARLAEQLAGMAADLGLDRK